MLRRVVGRVAADDDGDRAAAGRRHRRGLARARCLRSWRRSATGVVFGVVPAMQATRFDIREALNEEGRGSPAGGVRHHRMRSVLVVAEVALALVLLVGAGVMLRSFVSLQRVQPGFDPSNLLVIDLPLSPTTYRDDLPRTTMVDRVVERVRTLPSVALAAMTTGLPMSGGGATIHFNIAGRPPKGPEDYTLAGYRAVTPGYFETMGIPLMRGRALEARDRQGAPAVAVINESMAQAVFRRTSIRSASGSAIGTEPDAESVFMEIVGVVGDVRQSFEAGAKAEYYVPYGAVSASGAGGHVSQRLAGRCAPPAIRRRWCRSARGAAGDRSRSAARQGADMEQAIGDTVAQPRLQALLLTIFASCRGGACAHRRLRRDGLCRVAADSGDRRARGARCVASATSSGWWSARRAAGAGRGSSIGLVGAAFATRAMQSLLFETSGIDPLAFIAAPLRPRPGRAAGQLHSGASRRIGRADRRAGAIGDARGRFGDPRDLTPCGNQRSGLRTISERDDVAGRARVGR